MSTKININSKQYHIPDRLTVEQYANAIQFDWDDAKYYPMIVSQLTGAPIAQLRHATKDAMTLAIAFCVKSMNERTETKMINLEDLTFGQWVDLDTWIVMGLDVNFKKIAALLAPEAKWADEVMWAIDRYAGYRTHTYRQYSRLFGLDELADPDEMLQKDRLATARSWYKIIVNLAQNDVLKMDAITREPLKKILNFMALQKEHQLEENQRKLQERRQYDLQRNSR